MVENEAEGSPWDGPAASYKAVPPVNPKTGEPVQIYVCTLCGGAVISRKIHTRAHRDGILGKSFP